MLDGRNDKWLGDGTFSGLFPGGLPSPLKKKGRREATICPEIAKPFVRRDVVESVSGTRYTSAIHA